MSSGKYKYITADPSPSASVALAFALTGPRVEYKFHVTPSGELVHEHFGSPTSGNRIRVDPPLHGWGGPLNEARREFPDHGRGDFRLPAIRVRHGAGKGVVTTRFKYDSYTITTGKPALEGLPSTFVGKGTAQGEVETLTVKLVDECAELAVDLKYSIFPKTNIITRSFTVTNHGEHEATVERASSFSVDMEEKEWEMVYLAGDWTREGVKHRRKVEHGIQGFQSSTGYSSHYHNPFVSLVSPSTTDHAGEAYGWSLIYTGSFSVDVEKFPSNDRTRVLIGLNPLHLDWPLLPGATFTSPEVAAVYEPTKGLGGMSRSFHTLYRDHLCRSTWTKKERPVLINNWEATYFDFTGETLTTFAKGAAELGIKLFVMDDGWFGDKKPRVDDHAGLGDWVPNPKRFKDGLPKFVEGITAMNTTPGSGSEAKGDGKMKFGIWVEPEMVNRNSELFDAHPDWALQVEGYDLTEQRQQLVLDLSRAEVQDYIIDSLSTLLSSADISYVKWDNNRGMHELPHPSVAHAYILGLYRVLDTLTTRFPDVLWEGCASGGGRFDPGLLHYWCQSWTSDDTDALERLPIQFGTSLVYPPSSFGCHVSACPNEQVHRTTPLSFRAHVALMGGSFGFELDLAHLSTDERAQIPGIVDLAERVNPYVIKGDMYRLVDPPTLGGGVQGKGAAESAQDGNPNWPGVMYVDAEQQAAVVLAYQIRAVPRGHPPALRLQGLEEDATYEVKQEGKGGKADRLSGAALLNQGLWVDWHGDFDSRVFWVKKVQQVNGH